MNGFIKRTVSVVCVGGAIVLGGCCQDCKLEDCYDHCWLERYALMANQSVKQNFGGQVNNGHVLDQTVFTYDFEPGSDSLTKGGQVHLAYLARRRPQPDTKVYLQTAQDVVYDPAVPDQYTAQRAELDSKRVVAIQRFLNAETAGRPLAFEVVVHDAPTPGLTPIPGKNIDGRSTTAIQYYNDYKTIMPPTTSGSSALGGGAK